MRRAIHLGPDQLFVLIGQDRQLDVRVWLRGGAVLSPHQLVPVVGNADKLDDSGEMLRQRWLANIICQPLVVPGLPASWLSEASWND